MKFFYFQSKSAEESQPTTKNTDGDNVDVSSTHSAGATITANTADNTASQGKYLKGIANKTVRREFQFVYVFIFSFQ